jgi:pimeloyl-ACP methyl ester carboxylesterase
VALAVLAIGSSTVADERPSAANIQRSVEESLSGAPGGAVSTQRALAQFMGWRAQSPRGIEVFGDDVRVTDLNAGFVRRELNTAAPIHRVFRIGGRGPKPLSIALPPLANRRPLELYQRVGLSLYMRTREQPAWNGDVLSVSGLFPGVYVSRPVDEYSNPEPQAGFFERPILSTDPEAKADWKFTRVDADDMTGPIPILLIGGLSGDRWEFFRDWARRSRDAALFRQQFQFWRYDHPTEGVNAAIGFNTTYPAYEESMVAYLNRFIDAAESEGVVTDGVRHFFPEGPIAFVTHSQGGLLVRALMQHYPDRAERTIGAVTLSCPHMGTPISTPEWTRQSLGRLGFALPSFLDQVVPGLISEFALQFYISTGRQADLDTAWLNGDAVGGFGMPTTDFQAWIVGQGLVNRTVSPRDANQTNARMLPDIPDETFEPPLLLETFCGGLDEITPSVRGELNTDKLFLYGAFIDPLDDIQRWVTGEAAPRKDDFTSIFENTALRLIHQAIGLIESAGPDFPTGVYFLGDGFVPLQSQLMLDGAETELIYETREFNGWTLPRQKPTPRMDIIEAHTLGDPDRLRLLPGWTHLDTVTGRYDAGSRTSDLFEMIAADLLSVVPMK